MRQRHAVSKEIVKLRDTTRYRDAAMPATSDTGTLGDSKTNDTTPTLSGTGEPDATITVKDAAGKWTKVNMKK